MEDRTELELLLDYNTLQQNEYQVARRSEPKKRTITEMVSQEAGEQIRKAVFRTASTVAAGDDTVDDSDLSPSTSPCSSSRQQMQSREGLNCHRDKDEWIKEQIRTQAAIEKK